MSTRRRRSPSRSPRRGGLIAIALVLFVGGLLVGRLMWREAPAPEPIESEPAPPAAVERPVEPPAEPPVDPEVVPIRVALVIDDLGRSLEDLDRLGSLKVPISYSVLPFEVLTPEVVSKLREREEEILCHLPMQPGSDADPGPGALWSSMSSEEMQLATVRALEAVAGSSGVNNHMGSVLSADPEAMQLVGTVLLERDLFFLDSRTSADSVAFRVIRELGVASAERQVFLDPDLGVEAIREQFQRLITLARQQGAAIGIGHPHPVTFQVLDEQVPAALAAGVEFVPVSYLLERSSDPS